MVEKFNLEGKTALITGGGTGIGCGIATAFSEAGAQVIISGRRESVLLETATRLGPQVNYIVNDITDFKGLPTFVDELEEKYGPIDILINNAGVHLKAETLDTSDQQFLEVIQTNLLSVFSLSRIIGARMIQNKRHGSIIMISSMAAIMGLDRVVAYATAKAGLTGMMHTMAADFSPYGIRVNAIAPGWIHSDMFSTAINSDQKRQDKIMSRIPLKRFGDPADIGNAAVFLSSNEAKYITGVLLPVDGGAASSF